MELSGKHILLGITGGIAAYKSAELVRLLVKQGASVQVAMSEAATHFIAPLTFQALSGKPVITDPWAANTASGMAHIALSREADLLLIAPATKDCTAVCIWRADCTSTRVTPRGVGRCTGPATSVTCAPAARAAAAMAKPILPLERLVMPRTGSMASKVGPALTSTC